MKFFETVLTGLNGKRGSVLFQLPPSLTKDVPLLADFLEEVSKTMKQAFEFRHSSWFDDEVFTTLGSHQAALCIAESAELATPAIATADFGYLRLRREDYSTKELSEWAEKIQKLQKQWTETFVYFKHEKTGSGPVFGRQMALALG